MFPQEIIRHKREKLKLSEDEINFFIKGVTDGSISDAQTGAFTMAAFLNGLDSDETVHLTRAMRDSGDVLKWDLDGPVIDKHSTGGVGDKVSLMLAPILAACGGYVPMISGRGLGHTGGTLDKMDSVPGYQTHIDNQKFKTTVQKIGCAIIGQTGNLAPADKKIYAIRDVCGTVESIPLITASILSKKLAAGLDYLVMDLKCGSGAFMENRNDASALARSIVNVANGAGTKTTALVTDMNEVLGSSVGNALEVEEAVLYLQNKNVDKRLDQVTRALCAELLLNSGLAVSLEQAHQKISTALSSGAALEKFAQMVSALGGPADLTDHPQKYLPKAQISRPVFANSEGYVERMPLREVGLLIIGLKGGRVHPDQKLDYATGFTDFCHIGDYVSKDKPLAVIHAQTEEQYHAAAQSLRQLIQIGTEKRESNVLLEKIS